MHSLLDSRTDRRLRGIAYIAVVAIAILAALALASTAQAGKGWCRVDPVFIIDDQITDVFVGSDLSALTSTTGPIKIVLAVPPTTEATMVISDLGFGHGYDIEIVTSDSLMKTGDYTQVEIKVYVPANRDSLPISVYFSPRLLGILNPVSVDGNANTWITLSSGV
jgi:hypothetical protein